ncbi:hypothetical protein [Brevibacterium album]|uniref:hypothetical protein n=1 Tax=Brevibacterium album TaxID=417948 RepID=UPI000687AC65|nr:hypothetical protein [Brevibacterium album]
MSEIASLEEQASEFAEEITATVRAVSPGCAPFVASLVKDGRRLAVRQEPDTGIPLCVGGEALLSLKVSYHCTWDGVGSFLAIDTSTVKVFASPQSGGQPLFRYEYERSAHSKPAARLHIHGHRDSFTYVMTRAGRTTRQSQKRVDQDRVPAMQDLHFPLGGHRFRPCLEDVLEMLIDEFGIDDAREARTVLRQGRARWRRNQVRSAVRDDPESAVGVLSALGYTVTWDREEAEPAVREDRLEAP